MTDQAGGPPDDQPKGAGQPEGTAHTEGTAPPQGTPPSKGTGRMIRNIVTLGGWTLVSRGAGLARELMMANYLGAGAVADDPSGLGDTEEAIEQGRPAVPVLWG